MSQLNKPFDNIHDICAKLTSRLEYFVRCENIKNEFRSLASVFNVAVIYRSKGLLLSNTMLKISFFKDTCY